jgi:uncharacterized membrane protein YraQ (UPF0718 family)
MNATTLILVIVAAILLAIAFYRGRDLPMAGLMAAGRTLWRNLPILLLGFLIAGLVQLLVPQELISRWLGTQSGVKGVLLSCLVGGLVPGSPYAIFPLVAGFYRAGAGLGAVVGFVSAWSLWSVSRLPIEMALIDPNAALIRFGITFIVPPIAGLIANVATRLL